MAKPPWEEYEETPDYLGRGRYFGELTDPRVRDRLISYTHAEVGGQGPEAQLAFIETSLNRGVARNQPLSQVLSGSYFPGVTHSRASRSVSQSMREHYDKLIEEALYGSNITNFATGNASGTVGFAGGPQTYKAGGERFGIEGPDRGWWTRVGAQVAPTGPWNEYGSTGTSTPVAKKAATPGPWDDYAELPEGAQLTAGRSEQVPVTPTAQAAPSAPKGPWDEYADAPEAPTAAPATPPAEGGSYTMEALKAPVRGAGLGAAESLKGLGTLASRPSPFDVALRQAALGPNANEAIRQLVAEEPQRVVAEHPLTRAGQAVEAATTAAVPSGKVLYPFVEDVLTGAGTMATTIGTSLVPGVGPALTAAAVTGQGASEAYDRAIRDGATPEQAMRAASMGVYAGATDLVDAFFPGLAGGAKSLIRKAALGAVTEGTQEGTQQFLQNVIAKTGYKPGQQLSEDVLYNALVGGTVGGVVGGALGAVGREQAPQQVPPVTPEQFLATFSPKPEATIDGEKLPQPQRPEDTAYDIPPTPGIRRQAPQQDVLTGATEVGMPTMAPVFYSKLLEAAQQKLPESGNAQQVLATLRNTPGVKEEEIQDTGLETWIKSQEGKVSKRELVEWLEQNQIQVETVIDTTIGRPQTAEWALVEGGTQFDFAVAPGPKLEYMELKLRVPPRNEVEAANTYGGPHWSESNVVAHVRATTRVDKAGQPVLHIEEIQSDWQQEGRKRGFMSPQDQQRVAAVEAERMQLQEDMRAMGERLDENQKVRNNLVRARAGMTPEQRVRIDAQIAQIDSENNITDAKYSAASRRSHDLWTERRSLIFGEERGKAVGLKKIPQAPFRSNWVDLAAKRMFRWAADRGYSKISWQSPELAILYNTGAGGDVSQVSAGAQAGLKEFYGKIIPSRMKALAKRYGGVLGETQFGDLGSVFHVTVPETARTAIQRGLTLYNRPIEIPGVAVQVSPNIGATPQMVAALNRMGEIFTTFSKQFNFSKRVVLMYQNGVLNPSFPNARGLASQLTNGNYLVQLDISAHNNIAEIYNTLMHELGHIVMWDKFDVLPDGEKNSIRGDFEKWLREAEKDTVRIGDVLATRQTAIGTWAELNSLNGNLKPWLTPMSKIQGPTREYILHFDEWFADQVARWATSTEVPITVSERIYKGIANVLRKWLEYASKALGVRMEPTQAMKNWLDSFMTDAMPFMGNQFAAVDVRTLKENQGVVQRESDDPDVEGAPQQPETSGVRAAMSQIFNGNPPPQVRAMAGHADKINLLYKYMAGVHELRDANPNLPQLHQFVETLKSMDEDQSAIISRADQIARDWRRLGKGGEVMVQFFDELANMTYLTPTEQRLGVVRQPTPQEVLALGQRIGMTPDIARVATAVKQFFDQFLLLTSQNAKVEALKLTDPVERAKRIMQIDAQVANLQKRPYFPFMRFGRHYVTVRDTSNKVIHFETFERKGLVSAERRQQRKAQELRGIHGAVAVSTGVLPESTEPFIGMPPALLQHIRDKMNMTPAQLDALEQLQFELSPALSFRHHFQHKNYTAGYSRDFLRAFSRYGFHGARYYARTKHADTLRQIIRDTRKIEDNKVHRIADYMTDVLDKTVLDAKGDFGIFKGFIFLQAMGYVPAAATMNLTQTPMVTFPWLSSVFGSPRSSAALTRAMANVSNFYKKGTYLGANTPREWEMRAIGYGIKSGHITETQAADLAGLAQGNNLLYGAGGDSVQRLGNFIMEKSAWMFEMAEQFNRRVAFRAALELATGNPNNAKVKEIVARNPQRYDTLVRVEGFTPAQAQAIVFALDAVDTTQFVYKRYARPRFMRGRIPGTIFVFKRYIQSLIFLNINNPSFMWRYMLMATLMGGMGGLPGYEDLKELVEGVGKLLGFDVDWERFIRRHVLDFADGKIPPDLVLHGLARRGFGVPALLDALGSQVTGTPGRGFDSKPEGGGPMPGQNVPYPQLDRSKAISPGLILPVSGKLLDPTLDWNKVVAEEAQRASGAVFSSFANMARALMDNQLAASDPKRWERALPRALANASKALRTYSEERERFGPRASGSTIINYDPRDTEQMMEIFALAGGYNNLRATGKWDYILAQNEHVKWIEFNRNALLKQYREAQVGGYSQELDDVKKKIQEFNFGLGDADKGMAISADTIRKSLTGAARERLSREVGVPRQRGKVLGARETQELYPEATIDVRRR